MPRLFGPEELCLRAAGPARRRLTQPPDPTPAGRRRRSDEDRKMILRLRELGADLASRFRLPYRTVERERDGVLSHYGICYEDGLIRIRLRHATTRRVLKESSLVDTLCHELAHLRHLDHSPEFKQLYLEILAEARQLGYYRPGRSGDHRPRQRLLFDEAACGVRPRT